MHTHRSPTTPSRLPMPETDAATPTYSVAELHDVVNNLLEHVFGDEIWVQGEIRNLNRAGSGHVYFELADAGSLGEPQLFGTDAPPLPAGPRPTLSVVLFSTQRQEVNRYLGDQGGSVRMKDGVRVRIRGRLRTYPTRSTIQLAMSTIDPAFTLGVMGLERDVLLAELTREGILRSNAARPLRTPPLHVAVLTSVGSAAHADVLAELVGSGLGFSVSIVDCRTQGPDCPASVTAALGTAARLHPDLALLVRGGGARTDLVGFDHRSVARAIASSPIPVWTGIGHETDRSVADEVAHVAHKTPTAAASAVVAIARVSQQRLDDVSERLSDAAGARLDRVGSLVDRLGRGYAAEAVRQTDRASTHVLHLSHRLISAAGRAGATQRTHVDGLARRLTGAAAAPLDRRGHQLAGLAARARAHDVDAALRRGWSITRSSDGSLVRSPADAAPGDALVVTTAGGLVHARATDPSGSDTDGGRP